MLLPMLRPPCDTAAMSNDDVSTLLATARGRLVLAPAGRRTGRPLAAGRPLRPLARGVMGSTRGRSPTSPRWRTTGTASSRRVATSGLPEPVPFGRIATDDDRLDNIRRERTRPPGELFDADRRGARRVRCGHWASWSPAERARIGLHPARGEITVEAGAERFFGGHLDEHAAQLEGSWRPTPGGG